MLMAVVNPESAENPDAGTPAPPEADDDQSEQQGNAPQNPDGNHDGVGEIDPPAVTPDDPDKDEGNPENPPESITPPPQHSALSSFTVAEMKEQGYTLTDKVFDESCVFARLSTPYDLPDSFSYGFKAYDKTVVTTYTDGTESTVKTIRISKERPAIDLYMGYIIYDDNGTQYLIGPDGAVLCAYKDSEYIPAYTRDLQGRPLFYKYEDVKVEYPKTFGEADEDGVRPWDETGEYEMRVKVYYYLSEDGKTFEKSDYNDLTDNRGLYFDYPSYYGKTDSEFSRYFFNTTKYHTDLEGEMTVSNILNWTYSNDEKMDIDLFRFDEYGILANDDEDEESKEGEETDEEKEEDEDKKENEGDTENEEPKELPVTLPLEKYEKKKKEDEEEKPTENPDGEDAVPLPTIDELFPYTMAYNFSEKYATVLMDIDWSYDHDMEGDGVTEMKTYDVTTNELRVINEKGEIMFDSRKNYLSEFRWMANEKYTAPLARTIDSLGSYYFDHGYMRVRVVSWDCYQQAQYGIIKVVTDEDVLIDPSGKRFDMPSGYKLVSYSDGILLLEKDGKYGYMSYYGTWVRDPDMDDAKPFLEGVAVCTNVEGKYGVIDTDGNTVIPFTYDYISNISSGTIAAYSQFTGWTIYQKLTK